MDQFKKLFGRFRRDEKGVTLVEYGVAVALAVGLGVAALDRLSGDVGDAMDAAGAEMPNTAAEE